MTRLPREDDKPWYKQFWPWFIISIPAATVVASMFTIKIAVDSADGLVSDDYYKEGLAINKDLSRELLTKTLGLTADFSLDKETRELRTTLTGKLSNPPQLLELELFHPTIKGFDQRLKLLAIGNGAYVTRLPEIPTTSWRISLTPENNEWKLSGRARFPETTKAKLVP